MAGAFQTNDTEELTYQQRYYQERRTEKLAYARANRARQNERRRERMAGRPKRQTFPYHATRERALAVVAAGEPLCVGCGLKDIRILVINHKDGNGNIERREGMVGKSLYKAIVMGTRRITDLDVRCHNCNVLYEYERGRLS
jgi:hypothetical protein